MKADTMKKIFITGATGFLGGEELVFLSKDERVKKIYCLIRAANQEEANKRLEAVFAVHGDYLDRNKIIAVVGDLTDLAIVNQLKGLDDVDTIIHCAADTSFNPTHRENIHRVNIVGASNVAKWAASLPNLKTFVYVGTSWICGCDRPDRIVHEDESPNKKYKQLTYYTESKTAGELIIRDIIPKGKLLVVRPSIIMGDSRPWEPRSFTISWAPAVFNLLRLIPARVRAENDVIPIDYAVKAITELIFNEKRKYDIYHISSGKQSLTDMERLTAATANNNGGRPPFCYVNPNLTEQMHLFAKGQLPEDAELRKYSQYLSYWKKTFNGDKMLDKLIWAIGLYYDFVNMGLIFDNSRLLEDTTVGLSEPAHVYMGRNKEILREINIMGEAENP